MVWVALAYGMLASGLMLWVGAPLVGYVGRKNEAEGYFRFAMMRIRDNAESVALMNGGRYEQAILGRFYDTVVARWLAIVWQHAHLTWITNACGPMKPIVPLLFLAPKYLAGDLSLGQVTQLAAAFVEVQIAISWVVDNYNRVAEWYASARRVMDIVDACAVTDQEALSGKHPAHGAAIRVTDFEIADGRNRPLLSGTGFAAAAGEAVHIYGESSTGKSTLVRVLAGLWPIGRGAISVPDSADIMIAPQKAYLPLGSLRGALLYPSPALEVSDTRLASALEKVGLGSLVPRLAEAARWDQVLSNGERQRLGIARLAIHAPRAVILDDALSALDEGTQAALFAHLRAELPTAIIISLAQRPAPGGLNDRQLCLERDGESSILRAAGMPSMAVAQ
jgi:vitamin B12/bleomycin/antimicrobial peptide transport system ATP-binding/permease protein